MIYITIYVCDIHHYICVWYTSLYMYVIYITIYVCGIQKTFPGDFNQILQFNYNFEEIWTNIFGFSFINHFFPSTLKSWIICWAVLIKLHLLCWSRLTLHQFKVNLTTCVHTSQFGYTGTQRSCFMIDPTLRFHTSQFGYIGTQVWVHWKG